MWTTAQTIGHFELQISILSKVFGQLERS